MLREAAVFRQVKSTVSAVVDDPGAVGGFDRQIRITAVIPVMACIADGAIPVIVACVVFIPMAPLAFRNDLLTDRAFLIVFVFRVIPPAAQGMSSGRSFLLYDL